MGLDALGGSDDLSVVGLEVGRMGDDVVFAAGPVLARVAGEVYFLEVGEFGESDGAVVEVDDVDEVDGHIEFGETLAALDVFNFGDIVKGHVEVLEFFEFVEVLHLLDDVVLEVEDLEVTAEDVQVLYFDKFLLVERDLGRAQGTSSRVVSRLSLCSDRFLRRSSVIRDIFSRFKRF